MGSPFKTNNYLAHRAETVQTLKDLIKRLEKKLQELPDDADPAQRIELENKLCIAQQRWEAYNDAPTEPKEDSEEDLKDLVQNLERCLQELPDDATKAERVRLEYRLSVARRKAAGDKEPPKIMVEYPEQIAKDKAGAAFKALLEQLDATSTHLAATIDALEANYEFAYYDRMSRAVRASWGKLDQGRASLENTQELVAAAKYALWKAFNNPPDGSKLWNERDAQDMISKKICKQSLAKNEV